jgi:transposase
MAVRARRKGPRLRACCFDPRPARRRIAELYEIEAEIRGKSADERRVVRQEKTKPRVATLKTWLEKILVQVASGSSIAQAIRYGLNHWDGLVRFLDDGRIEIDSNTSSAAKQKRN